MELDKQGGKLDTVIENEQNHARVLFTDSLAFDVRKHSRAFKINIYKYLLKKKSSRMSPGLQSRPAICKAVHLHCEIEAFKMPSAFCHFK